MEVRDELINDIVLGKRLEQFFNSDIGQYLILRITNETIENTELLINADPYDTVNVQQIQNKILVTRSIKNWLEDVLTQAIESEARLNEIEDAV